MSNEPSNALAVVDRANFPVLANSDAPVALRRAIEEYGADFGSLTRIRLPSGGMLAWEIPSPVGEADVVKEFTGVIAHVKMNEKAWWRTPMGEGQGGSPPDCTSRDGISGFGVNSLNEDAEASEHECMKCQWNQFGSSRGPSSEGKDCSDMAQVWVFRAGSRLPSVLIAPATSLKGLTRYCIGLVDIGQEAWRVMTRFGLEPAVSRNGTKYAKLKLTVARPLDESEVESMAKVADVVRELSTRLRGAPIT